VARARTSGSVFGVVWRPSSAALRLTGDAQPYAVWSAMHHHRRMEDHHSVQPTSSGCGWRMPYTSQVVAITTGDRRDLRPRCAQDPHVVELVGRHRYAIRAPLHGDVGLMAASARAHPAEAPSPWVVSRAVVRVRAFRSSPQSCVSRMHQYGTHACTYATNPRGRPLSTVTVASESGGHKPCVRG